MESTFAANNLFPTLQRALALEIPYGERRREAQGLRPDAVAAAVLALFGFSGNSPYLLFTQRTETVEHHKGQISFPGGRAEPLPGEPGATLIESPESNALRETQEEVGIDPARIQIAGKLPELATVTGFRVTPVIGVLSGFLEDAPLVYQVEETHEAFWVSLTHLIEPGVYRDETLQVGSLRYPIQVFLARDSQGIERRIWGATASILKNILDRLHALS